ncbi:hypothetical protein ACSSNL_00145 [Thalassobius sp. S69A]|uniref:hypothetical protein n=1 Tax=unclassified Thalassovita TaxID=2619711 RepID=UPI003C7BAB5E
MEYFLLLGLGGALALTALFGIFEDSSDDTASDDDAPEDTPEDETIRVTEGGTVTTGDGDDVIITPEELDAPVTINSGAGDDLIDILADGDSQVDAGSGDDIVRTDGRTNINGGDGDDILESTYNPGGWQNDGGTFDGGDGDDHLIAHGDTQNMYGGAGNDTITAENLRFGEYLGGEGDDTFELEFDDLYYRHDIDETISGGTGDDVFRITNVSHQSGFFLDADGNPDTYHFGVTGGEGADTFEVIHQIEDNNFTSSSDPDFTMSNSTWIRDFDPDEDVLIITPEDTGVFSGTPTLTIETDQGVAHRHYIELVYTAPQTGVEATWRIMVDTTRTLTEDDIVLNLAA